MSEPSEDEEIEVEAISDPLWSPALDALTLSEKSDPKPFAELLRSDAEIPLFIRSYLADLLDPPHKNSVTLVLKRNRHGEAAIWAAIRDVRIKDELVEMERVGEKLALVAVPAVAKKYGVSESQCWKVWTKTEDALVNALVDASINFKFTLNRRRPDWSDKLVR